MTKSEADVCLGFTCPVFMQQMISVFTLFLLVRRKQKTHTEKHFPKVSAFLHNFWCILPNLHVNVSVQFKHAATHFNKLSRSVKLVVLGTSVVLLK